MSVAFPWVLWATFAAVAGVVAAHLLSVTQPRALQLPTARFVPERAVRAVSRASTPRDVLLLMVRVFALACTGIALAGVSADSSRVPVRTIVAVDGGALALGDTAALHGALQRAAREFAPVGALVLGDTLVNFTDAATSEAVLDSLLRSSRSPGSATLAATLLRALRAAPSVAVGADSVRLVLVSTDRADVTSDALAPIRATWPGRIERITVPLSSDAADSEPDRLSVTVRAADDDVVAASFALWSDFGTHRVLVVRDSLQSADSAAALEGAAIVAWTRNSVPPGWNAIPDSADLPATAVVVAGQALVAPFRLVARAPDSANALIWYPDGSVAATEVPLGRGCVRWIGFDAPAGDALLSVTARALLSTLSSACGSARTAASSLVLDSAVQRQLEGRGALASSASLGAARTSAVSPLTRWLLLSALLLLVLETVLRSRASPENGRRTSAKQGRDGERMAPEAAA